MSESFQIKIGALSFPPSLLPSLPPSLPPSPLTVGTPPSWVCPA